ncbi:MAG: hypothetical protein EA370_08100 [Wenzhouxiangella sp.]|nr:MAG: hypothetical protein EA370_08100 [Wenzhouxiangella sp.]
MRHTTCPTLFAALFLLCASAGAAESDSPQDDFWRALSGLCGQAFAGRLVSFDESIDAGWLPERLVIHVRECSDHQILIPLHVGEDRSRTWVLTRLDDGIRLKHDHRLENGDEDDMTWYGGHTTDPGRSWRQVFPVDDFSRLLFLNGGLEGSVANIWYMDVRPGEHFAYGLTRAGRHLRAEFDLSETIEPPPAPWGHE